ncbi:MAG: hypothetical protein HY903_03710 [Deltaproteobacteria bacterium]|nr:hypothetical protein [Deltaproteobacteria bacterium]
MTAPRVTAADLLSIDVEAEVQKLCGRQLEDEVATVAEVCRFAIQSGAIAVQVDLGRRRVRVAAPGGAMPSGAFEAVAVLADPGCAVAARHRALVELEVSCGVGLLALLAAPTASLGVSDSDRAMTLVFCRGRAPGAVIGRPTSPGLVLTVARSGSRRVLRRALREKLAYASVPVFLDGRATSRGPALPDCLVQLTVETPRLSCRVGLPRHADLSRSIVVVGEVVAKEVYTASRRGAVHLAVVRDKARARAPAVDLRVVHDLVREVRDTLYVRLAALLGSMSVADQDCARRLLLRYALQAGRLELLAGVPLFRTDSGAQVDLQTVRSLCTDGVLWAVEPPGRGADGKDGGRRTLVLDGYEREFLLRAFGLTVEPPPAGYRRRLAAAVWSQVAAGASRVRQYGRGFVAGLMGVRPIHESFWADAERGVIRAIEALLTSGRYVLPTLTPGLSRLTRVALVEHGRLPLAPRRFGSGFVLLVPRRHPQLQRMARALEADPGMLYPLMAVLFGGHDGFGGGKTELQAALFTPGPTP